MTQKMIRYRRKIECFPVVNRGALWYDGLTEVQRAELDAWYHAWLDAPETGVVPATPAFLKQKNTAEQEGN